MRLDINEVVAEMLSAIKGAVSGNWKEAKGTANQFFQNRKERLALLALLRINGDLTQEKFESYLEDEKLVLEAELHAVAIITKATAQKAANAALLVLQKAVGIVVSPVL